MNEANPLTENFIHLEGMPHNLEAVVIRVLDLTRMMVPEQYSISARWDLSILPSGGLIIEIVGFGGRGIFLSSEILGDHQMSLGLSVIRDQIHRLMRKAGIRNE